MPPKDPKQAGKSSSETPLRKRMKKIAEAMAANIGEAQKDPAKHWERETERLEKIVPLEKKK